MVFLVSPPSGHCIICILKVSLSQHSRAIRNNIYLLFQSIRSNSYTERFKLDFRQEWSMEEIFLPNEFRCPICNGKLRLFRYKGKYGPYGYPMIGCGNWGKCKSPWRRRPERFPWHVWVGFDEDGTLRPQLTTPEHIHLDEEAKRHEHLKKIISRINDGYPELYQRILEFYREYRERRLGIRF